MQDGKVFKYQNCKRERKKKKTGVRYNTHTSLWRDIWGGGGVGKGNFN